MENDIREQVKKKYAMAIKTKSGCCSSSACCGGSRTERIQRFAGQRVHTGKKTDF